MKFSYALVVVITAAATGHGFQLPQSNTRGSYLDTESSSIHGRKVPVGKTYTRDAHFAGGTLININYDETHNQLQLDSKPRPFDFIWVAAPGRGTVVKIDTKTGEILGEYRSTPSSHTNGYPSQTAVDRDGSVWLSNFYNVYDGYGSVVHIGLLENNQCEDRNGNGVIDTSTGRGDIKDWADNSGVRGVATADDECIVHYTKVNSSGSRHVSVTSSNDVWVSGYSIPNFDLVKGGKYDVVDSGTIIQNETSVGYGGYGGLIDRNGVIWSAGNLLRWDTAKTLTGENGDDPLDESIGPPANGTNWTGHQYYFGYGLCIDSKGNVWNTQLSDNTIRKYAPDGTLLGAYQHGDYFAQGCVVGLDDDVYVAHSYHSYSTTVGHIKNDGTFVGNIDLAGGMGPTGVAVDRNGKIWAANYFTNTVTRIDPTLGKLGANNATLIGAVDTTKDLGDDAYPDIYSCDMTGSTLTQLSTSGTWTVTYNGNDWQSLEWNADIPLGATLTVRARSGNDGSSWTPWKTAINGMELDLARGKYLQIQVIFERPSDTTESPVLYDLSVIDDDVDDDCSGSGLPSLLAEPDVNYIKDNTKLDFSENSTDIIMDFVYNYDALYPALTIPTTFGAIITDNADGSCGGEIIGKTVNAHNASTYLDENPFDPFVVDIIVLPNGNPQVLITTDPDKFMPPFYTQDVECSAAEPDKPCGLLNFCVELQAFICERKVDYVDVNLQVKIDLTVGTGCAEDCAELYLKRDDVVDENIYVNPGDIECKPCYDDGGKKFDDSSSITVTKGSSFLACIEMNTPGACVLDINSLDLLVERSKDLWKRYCIISDRSDNDCLFLVDPTPNPDYDPVTEGYNVDDATVRFLTPKEEFKALRPGQTVPAHFGGSIKMGFGCCCDASCTCNPLPTPTHRHLAVDGSAEVSFVGKEFKATFDAEPGCKGFFLFCWIQAFLAILLSLFSFGLL